MSATRPPPLDLGNEKVSEREQGNSSLTPRRLPLPASASTPMSSTEVPVLGYGEAQSRHQPQATPLQSPDPQHVQFASYRADKSEWAGAPPAQADDGVEKFKSWTPLPLRVWFWLIYVVILVGGAIALEIALHYNRKANGWDTTAGFSSQSGVLHYAYTLPSVIISMVITSIWAWTDIEIKKMQPYVDLVHGDAPPQTTLLLDYTRTNNFLVWTRAMRNKHYVVTLSTLMVILSLCFSPLSASLFTVRDTYLVQPSASVNSLYEISLNQGEAFKDLTVFVTAAGYASAAELYGLGPPPWTHDGYALAQLDIPETLRQNGTMNVVTNAVLSKPNCHGPESLNRTKDNITNGVWHNTAVYKGCSYNWSVNKSTENLFGLDALGAQSFVNGQATGDGCEQFRNMPAQNQPIVLWFFTYLDVGVASSVSICEPSIELWQVNATVDLSTRNLTAVNPIRALKSDDPGAGLSGNVTGAPLNGQAYNGAAFDSGLFTSGDPFVPLRAGATTLQLPAAVMQAARDSTAGIAGSFESDAFVLLSSRIYQMYLQVFAQSVYFLRQQDTLDADITAWRLRLWLSDVAVHLIAAALLILAFFGSIVQILHRGDRSNLRLGHAPGTIASAVALGGQTDVGAVLAGRQGADDIQQALADKRFRMDPRTHKIVMEGENGYEDAKSPDPRRGSMFVMLQRGLSTRGPRGAAGTPPRTPMERVSDSS